MTSTLVWEICKFWILQNKKQTLLNSLGFERYVNFEFYKTSSSWSISDLVFERYVNFEFYKTERKEWFYWNSLRDM